VSRNDGRDAELRRLADEMEGVFYQQLFQAMRATLPESENALTRTGNDLFGAMMDDHMAEAAAMQTSGGLGAALYRQLAGAVSTHSNADAGPGAGDEG